MAEDKVRKRPPIIDLHTHSLYSDGLLLPAELVRHAEKAGYHAIALTDHAEEGNLEQILELTLRTVETLNGQIEALFVPGVELSYVPPKCIARAAARARELGAGIIVVHGETLVEPVPPGTNEAALQADIDLLAHPGLITEQLAAQAAERNIALEITTRRGHCFTNGHVRKAAEAAGAMLTVNNDAHGPNDFPEPKQRERIALGAGMSEQDYEKACWSAVEILANKGYLLDNKSE